MEALLSSSGYNTHPATRRCSPTSNTCRRASKTEGTCGDSRCHTQASQLQRKLSSFILCVCVCVGASSQVGGSWLHEPPASGHSAVTKGFQLWRAGAPTMGALCAPPSPSLSNTPVHRAATVQTLETLRSSSHIAPCGTLVGNFKPNKLKKKRKKQSDSH